MFEHRRLPELRGSFQRLVELIDESEIHDLHLDFVQMYPRYIPFKELIPLFGRRPRRNGSRNSFGRFGWAKRIEDGPAKGRWIFRLSAEACGPTMLRRIHSILPANYPSVRQYEAVIEIRTKSKAKARELKRLLERHAHVPYNRTGLVRVEDTSYIGNRKNRCKETCYIAPAKLLKTNRKVIRFQICILVPPGERLTLTELADLIQPKERIVELFTKRVRFNDFCLDNLTWYFARHLAGQRNGAIKKRRDQRLTQGTKPSGRKRKWRDPRNTRLAAAKHYCDLLVRDVFTACKIISFSTARCAAFWLSNPDLPLPYLQEDSVKVFRQRQLLVKSPLLFGIPDEHVYRALDEAEERHIDFATSYRDLYHEELRGKISRSIRIPNSKWATSYHLIRGRNRVNKLGLVLNPGKKNRIRAGEDF